MAGGPIGLRATGAIARVVMNAWDAKWLEKMEQINIKVKRGCRYVDDIRAFLKAIRKGWRWSEGTLCYYKAWEEEDRNKSAPRYLLYHKRL